MEETGEFLGVDDRVGGEVERSVDRAQYRAAVGVGRVVGVQRLEPQSWDIRKGGEK